MKKALLFTSMLVGFTLCAASYSNEIHRKTTTESLDQIVAIINDDVVTKSELQHSIALAKMQLEQGRMPVPATAALQKQVLDKIINKKLQLQVAKQASITVTDEELNQAIQNVAKQNQMTVAELFQHLNHDGMATAEYKTEMHDQILLQKLQQQEIVSHISVTDDEIKNFLHSKKWVIEGPKEYHVEDILIPMAENPTTAESLVAKKRADIVTADLRHGQKFNEIARAKADFNLQDSDLGWRKLEEMPSAFNEQVVHMQAHDVSAPVQAPNGLHLLYLLEAHSLSVKQPSPNHKQLEELLLQRKFEQAMQTWVSKLRSQAFIVMNPNK